ncbi:hypothetical protein TESG_04222 [Trichophyton tonsurans CBS 112818]|uniref:Uncharacterized protein n=1 Tax=Trichophyton tonsurans (strain CBS 112818) TaxID=647933 RepID=F2RZP2_TRIT1|nr:hypothetical protein TESG_04222 [Trichophyton tonsurans CBS 112818]
MHISFEGVGEALYCTTADYVERFFVRDSAHKTGATISLALSLWAVLSNEKDGINEKREAEDKQFRLKMAEKAEQEKQQEEDKRLQKVMAERREMLDKMTWIERILESDIEKLAVFSVLYILFPGIFVCIMVWEHNSEPSV